MYPRRFSFLVLVLIVTATAAPAPAVEPQARHVSPAPPPPRLPRGAVVVAAQDASVDDTWRLALLLYRDPALRPRGMDDAIARALAGERPGPNAGPRAHELFALRASLQPKGVTTRRLLASVASELGVSGVVLVFNNEAGQTRARLFVAKRGGFDDTILWREPDDAGRPRWASSVAWLSSLTGVRRKQTASGSSGASVFASPWFWGALTAVAGVVIVGYAASRDDEPETIHLQGRVSP